MKKTHCLLILLLSISLSALAQPDPGTAPQAKPPRIMGLKMDYVTKQLSLSTDEAQKFWPVYYSYSNEMRKTRAGQKEDVIALEEGMLNVRKKYKAEFKKILLTDERVNKALTVDRDFSNVVRKELLQRAKTRGPKAGRKGEFNER